MASKHFQNTARRAWWSVHIEAWQRSGLSRAKYCAQHRLDPRTFGRWIGAIGDAKSLHYKVWPKRRRGASRLCRSKHSAAVQAFWAMHVEALNWSGLAAAHYAAAHRISANSLRRWRDLLETGEVQIDWRARLHPSALPKLSPSASSAAKESGVESALTGTPNADPPHDGRSHRRHFTSEEKLAIVLECERPGASVSAIARAHQLATRALFRWRAEFGYGRKEKIGLVPVLVARERLDGLSIGDPATAVLHDLIPEPNGMTAVELPDGRRVFAPAGSDPEAVRRHVLEQEAAR